MDAAGWPIGAWGGQMGQQITGILYRRLLFPWETDNQNVTMTAKVQPNCILQSVTVPLHVSFCYQTHLLDWIVEEDTQFFIVPIPWYRPFSLKMFLSHNMYPCFAMGFIKFVMFIPSFSFSRFTGGLPPTLFLPGPGSRNSSAPRSRLKFSAHPVVRILSHEIQPHFQSFSFRHFVVMLTWVFDSY